MKEKKILIARQGDVDLFLVKKPKGLKPLKSRVIAEGEATGHNHVVEPIGDTTTTIYADDDGTKYIEFDGSIRLHHPEHNKDDPMVIKNDDVPEGYVLQRQIELEYDPWSKHIRKVID